MEIKVHSDYFYSPTYTEIILSLCFNSKNKNDFFDQSKEIKKKKKEK